MRSIVAMAATWLSAASRAPAWPYRFSKVVYLFVEGVGKVRRGAARLAAGQLAVFQQQHFQAFFAEQVGRGEARNAAAYHHVGRRVFGQRPEGGQGGRGAKPGSGGYGRRYGRGQGA